MPQFVAIPLIILGVLAAVTVGVVLVMYVLIPLAKATGWVVRQAFRFIAGELGDGLRIVGGVITTLVAVPLVIGSIIIGRWSAAGHYGRAIQGEIKTIGVCGYRMVIGHPARLLCLTALTDGIERRLPQVVAEAPGPDQPSRARVGQFEGYTIVGSLPGGGSGSKLFIAEPDELKRAAFERVGQRDVGQVVIKVFSLRDGSSLPQIVRESRALDAAKKLGLVLEHELTDERFFYVTRYVAGESLTLVTQRLHASSTGSGLGPQQLRAALGYIADLLRTLDTYHRGGLWHKDVKPDNIVVDRSAAHLVDFGLVTSLRSAMTLTTHGTEYFRDPEMVRMALKGVKVHEVNGAKFDIFGAGAVLYSVIENSFPAHGGLSQITLRCPETIRWIVRRAMTEYDKRYPSAGLMLADIEHVLAASDPFAIKPIDLPSMRGASPDEVRSPEGQPGGWVLASHQRAPEPQPAAFAAPPQPAPPPPPPAAAPARERPRIRLADWWTGRYSVEESAPPSPVPPAPQVAGVRRTPAARRPGRSASEQLAHARSRAAAARERAHLRMNSRRRNARNSYGPGLNPGVAAAVFVFLAACVGVAALVLFWGVHPRDRMIISGAGFNSAHGVLPAPAPAVPVAPARPRAENAGFRTELRGSAPAPVQTSGRVLVLSDLQPPLSEATAARIRAALDRLASSGLTLAGSFPGNTADGDELADQIELESQVRSVRGLLPLNSAEADRAVGDWLVDQGGVDLVIWWAPGDKGTDAPRFSVFPPRYEGRRNPTGAAKAAERQAAVIQAITGG